MKNKHFVNPNIIKTVSTIVLTASITFGSMAFTNSFFKKLLSDTKQSYRHLITTSLNAYSKMILTNLNNYKAYLDFIYDENFFASSSTEQIVKFITQGNLKLHKDFLNIFYIDENFTVHESTGKTVSLQNNGIVLKNYAKNQNNYFVSNGFKAPDGKKVFYIGRPVFDYFGRTKGSFGAAISINKLGEIVNQLKSIQENSLIIQDETGKFIFHPYEDWIFQNYEPDSKHAKLVSSKYVSSLSSGEVETVDISGNPILLTFNKIEGTKWTVGITTPKYKIDYFSQRQNVYKIFLILIALATILILFFVENLLIKTFRRKDLMLTTYDPLTNVWTRQKFETEANRLLRKHPYTKFMLVETDIRGFKFINQNFGEVEADKIIKFVAGLLKKESIRYRCIFGRGFADHFYSFVKVSSVRNAMNEFKAMNERLGDAIKQYDIPFQLKFGISFLMSSKKNKDVTVQTLIGQASFAKSIIKDNFVNNYSIYNSRLLKKINEERFLENNMEDALQNKEFIIMYQPKISLENDKIVGAEALVRWKNPKLGLLAPNKFIELFERNGFIKKLDFYVYEEVFKFIKKMNDEKQPIVPISINMSRNHSKPDKFMHDFMKIFKKYDIDPKLIEIEILERSVMDNNTLREITNLLHKEGFSVAMDDFGSGESSLNMLTSIPVDVLKFDRTFLLSATDEKGNLDSTSSNIIARLIDLGRSLNKKTIFEGVETKAQRDFLKKTNCNQVQGFLYSKPLSEKDFVQFMKENL